MPRITALLLPLALVSCSGAAAKAPAEARSPATPNPAGAPIAAAVAEYPQVAGTVAETMDAGGYTYVRLKTAEGEVWAAIPQTILKTGSKVMIGNAMWMDRFESKTLNRTFDRILFGTLVAPGTTVALPPGHPAAAEAAGPGPHAGLASSPADGGDVAVEKAAGKDGRTVAEIYASKATLKGTGVSVRGRVVKWNPEILGRNWIHLRDGSGSPEGRDNDITVTTTDTVAKGDTVVVRGTVALDRDFGAGYSYPVILENAQVVK